MLLNAMAIIESIIRRRMVRHHRRDRPTVRAPLVFESTADIMPSDSKDMRQLQEVSSQDAVASDTASVSAVPVGAEKEEMHTEAANADLGPGVTPRVVMLCLALAVGLPPSYDPSTALVIDLFATSSTQRPANSRGVTYPKLECSRSSL